MGCTKEKTSKKRGDCFEAEQGRQWFDVSGTAWLVGEAVRYLNGAEPLDERRYQHTLQLLRERDDATRVLAQLAHETSEDPTLRWNLLHVLGDAGNADAADYLVKAAVEPLPDRAQQKGCEGPFDNELLNRTMAVGAIVAVARRHPDASEAIVAIVKEHPARPVLIEAVKAAVELGLRDRVQEMLAEDDRWILNIKRVSHQELSADPERKDSKEVGFTPPRQRELHTAPSVCSCHCSKEG